MITASTSIWCNKAQTELGLSLKNRVIFFFPYKMAVDKTNKELEQGSNNRIITMVRILQDNEDFCIKPTRNPQFVEVTVTRSVLGRTPIISRYLAYRTYVAKNNSNETILHIRTAEDLVSE